MWKLYGKHNESVAIKTKAINLIESLERNVGLNKLFISKVRYIDYDTDVSFYGGMHTRIEPGLFKKK